VRKERQSMVPKRIGVLVPSTNSSVEADFQRLLTGKVTAHSERLHIPDGTMTVQFLDQMNSGLAEKIDLVAAARVDAIAYACTSGSFYRGPEWDEAVRELVQQRAGVPCVTTSTAVTQAFKALGVTSISVVTPYPEWTNQKLAEYYRAQGLDIKAVHGDSRAAAQGHRSVNDQEPGDIARFALEHFNGGAQALFCSCTAWRALECIPALEQELGVPVVTSNQATIWAVLKTINMLDAAVPVGRLFNVCAAH